MIEEILTTTAFISFGIGLCLGFYIGKANKGEK